MEKGRLPKRPFDPISLAKAPQAAFDELPFGRT